jgi:predicted metalloprotease with PDZ domain
MIRFFLFICALSAVLTLQAQEISYKLSMPKPQNHYFEVEMFLSNFKDKQLDIKMPVWAPGSYLVREFAKNVNLVKAYDEGGNELKVSKKSKNTWSIAKGKAKKVTVKYEVYAFELSVRTSFLDLTHGYVSGTGVFMYVDKYLGLKGKLDIVPFAKFNKVTTALPEIISASAGTKSFQFDNYDQLADCPIEIGNQTIFDFTSNNVKHTVAIYGEGNYDIPTLKTDMAKIVNAATNVFGENPNKEYVFIIHNVVDGQGGLEHTNSTTLSVNRWTYQGAEYLGFLSLVAHEYFHLWNVKRIRPIELGPFNYDEENYTSLLWVMEGFTSYYDELLMVRAGYYDKDDYLNKLQNSINYVEGSAGSRVQPVAHASFDAWIKAYRPNENSANTTMTYYTRGQVMAAILDAKIISKYKGEKCLDHFLQTLYTKYYKKMNRGFSEDEFKKELGTFLGEDMTEFFEKYINGTQIPPYNDLLGLIGLNVKDVSTTKPSLGANFRTEGGKIIVKGVRSGSAAEEAGLSVNDEVLGVNGYRAEQKSLEATVNGLMIGEKAELLISRDEILFSIEVSTSNYMKPQYSFEVNTAKDKLALLYYWLRADNN